MFDIGPMYDFKLENMASNCRMILCREIGFSKTYVEATIVSEIK